MYTHLVEVGHININISLIQFINQNSQAKTVLIVKINILTLIMIVSLGFSHHKHAINLKKEAPKCI